jgi:HK97 family phage major capsid protein
VLIKLSVELSEDSVNIDEMIERELAGQLALELDRAALLGSGSAPEPRGIVNQSGVGTTDFGGVAPTDYDFLIDAIGRVWALNHEPNARLYNASLATAIAKFKSSADSQPLRVPDVVAAVPAFRTNQIPNAGTSPDDTTLIVGDFRELMIGLRTSFRLESTRVAGDAFGKLQIWVRAYLRADVQLAHPEAFDVTTNVGL